MIRAAAIASLFSFPAAAATLEMGPGATRAAADSEALGSYEVPTGPWTSAGLPALTAEGRIAREAWQVPSSATTLQLLAPLRGQIAKQGYDVMLDCEADTCGGFDFRYAMDVLPEPEMHVDLGDYRFLSASRDSGTATDYVTLLVSRTATTAFVHLVTVGPVAETEEPAAAGAGTSDPPPLTGQGVVPEAPAPADLAARLESTGRVVLGDLRFETGSSRLAEGPFASLVELAAYLAANPERQITLVGHTDAAGGLDANIALSRSRARSVRDRLTAAHGVAARQLSADGVGFLMPLAPNLTEEGRALNRRVEVVLISTE